MASQNMGTQEPSEAEEVEEEPMAEDAPPAPVNRPTCTCMRVTWRETQSGLQIVRPYWVLEHPDHCERILRLMYWGHGQWLRDHPGVDSAFLVTVVTELGDVLDYITAEEVPAEQEPGDDA